VLVVVWLLVLAGAACQGDGLAGGRHHHLLDPDLSCQVVHHLALAAVQSRCEDGCVGGRRCSRGVRTCVGGWMCGGRRGEDAGVLCVG
jgi:hypothetical protein